MRIVVGCATMKPYPYRPDFMKPEDVMIWNTKEFNLGVVGSYQEIYESTDEDIIAYIHDDVEIYEEGWKEKVLREFEDPRIGIVGFGGALVHGMQDMYKTHYRVSSMVRRFYRSNVNDAEVHGERYTGSCDVAVLDGFALIVRRTFLDRIMGFTRFACDFFNYDYALCAFARRYGYKCRLVGIECHHFGGRTSVNNVVKNIVNQEEYDKAHRWFYEEFKDVMPCDYTT